MRHLSEEELIDVLMGEPRDDERARHLAECPPCQERFRLIAEGLEVAKAAEPIVPAMPKRHISFARFKHRALIRRTAALGAAAMLVLSLLGFQLKFDAQGFSMGFALFGTTTNNQEQRIAALEERLLEAIELNAQLTQREVDRRFDAVYEDRDENLGVFTEALTDKMKEFELKNAEYLVTLREDLIREARKNELRTRQ